MKLITRHFGNVAVRVNSDDITPPQGTVPIELINFVAERYQFTVRPIIHPQVPPQLMNNLSFQNGVIKIGEETLPILALVLVKDGDIASAIDTDLADQILDDVAQSLEERFKFRYSTTKQQRFYQSTLTVELDAAFENGVAALNKIGEIFEKETGRPSSTFQIKRLAFGTGDVVATQVVTAPATLIEQIEKQDFLLERRIGVPYDQPRIFSSAPLKTADHIRALEALERAFSK